MRLFVAINLPVETRKEIWEKAEPLRGRGYAVRWVGADAIHLTIKFLGEVSSHREQEVVTALDEAVGGFPPFVLPIGGFGAFPDPRRAKVIWVGCSAIKVLNELHHKVEERFADAGFPIEGRPFHPHLTLGRLKRGVETSRLRGLEGLMDRLRYDTEIGVNTVDLMQSTLTRAGAEYSVLHSAGLSG